MGGRSFAPPGDCAPPAGLLGDDPHSRRAVLWLFDEREIDRAAPDVSCMTAIQFLVRGAKLHCMVNMRSNDVILGLNYDLFFATMLQERLALELGVGLGWYAHRANSLHLYERHRDMAEAIAAAAAIKSRPMAAMGETDSISRFLAVEEAFRLGQGARAEALAERLPAYWRRLAKPLSKLSRKRHEARA